MGYRPSSTARRQATIGFLESTRSLHVIGYQYISSQDAWIHGLFRTILNSILRGHRGIISCSDVF